MQGTNIDELFSAISTQLDLESDSFTVMVRSANGKALHLQSNEDWDVYFD